MSSQVVPQGYKQTKVGVIPDDWEVVKLKDIVKVSQGLQIPISKRFIEPSKERVFYITIPYTEGKKIEYIENAKKSILCEKDDLLVVRTGSGVGKIITGVKGAFHNNFFKIKGFDNLNISFIYYFLTQEKLKFLMKTYASNSTIPDLPHGDFYSLDCILPPLKEQEKIANILTTWDNAINNVELLIFNYELRKKGLTQKLLSGEVRFDEFFDEWEDIKLGNIFYISTGTSKSKYIGDGNNYIIDMGSISKYGKLLATKNTSYSNDYLEYGDLVMPKDDIGGGQIIGKVAFVDCNNKYIFGDHIFRLKAKKDDSLFLSYLINSFSVNKGLKRKVTGSAQLGLNKKSVENEIIKLPSLQEQQKIAEVLTNADKEIDFLKNELEELKEQKKGLMQKLLTGEVRVKA